MEVIKPKQINEFNCFKEKEMRQNETPWACLREHSGRMKKYWEHKKPVEGECYEVILRDS